LFQHNYNSKFSQFEGCQVMRYHSLVLDRVPETYQLLASASDDGTVQAMRHRSKPLWGYQFHPESITTDSSQAWLQLFVENALHPKHLSLNSLS
jgi:Anthranilate/para-aminobenzoate synthases component II